MITCHYKTMKFDEVNEPSSSEPIIRYRSNPLRLRSLPRPNRLWSIEVRPIYLGRGRPSPPFPRRRQFDPRAHVQNAGRCHRTPAGRLLTPATTFKFMRFFVFIIVNVVPLGLNLLSLKISSKKR